ncbi:MAG: pilus assembly protein HicB, partial [Prevotella sp.]|nr:pilus assembly protein HicB [Prevotella sp.]
IKLTVIVEIAKDGTYGCYPADIDKDIGLSGYGETAQKAIEDFLLAYKETKDDNEKMGIETPE